MARRPVHRSLFSDTETGSSSESDDATGSDSESGNSDNVLHMDNTRTGGSLGEPWMSDSDEDEQDEGTNEDRDAGPADSSPRDPDPEASSSRQGWLGQESCPSPADIDGSAEEGGISLSVLCQTCQRRVRSSRAAEGIYGASGSSDSRSQPAETASGERSHDVGGGHRGRKRRRNEGEEETRGRKCRAVLAVLDVMADEQMDINDLLDWAFWGDEQCTQDARIRGMRRNFFHGRRAPGIIRQWHTPPRSAHSHKSRSEGGSQFLNEFAIETVLDLMGKEMVELEGINRVDGMKLTRENLTSFSIPEMEAETRTKAPISWRVLFGVAQTRKQKAVNRRKNPTKIVFFIICILLYSRNHHCSRLQQVLAIYFHFRGLTENGCDTLHALGVTRSTRYISDAVSEMSTEAMQEVEEMVDSYQSVSSYDNMLVPLRVFSQRLDNRSTPGARTAATIYIKKDAPRLDDQLNSELRKMRLDGMNSPITAAKVAELATDGYPAIEAKMVDEVLSILLDSPDFDRTSWPHRNHSSLKDSDAGRELPCGPDHVTLQYMLGSMDIPQATYEQNDSVIAELMRQLGFNTPEKLKEMSLNRILYIVGDQLTVDRIRGLQSQLCDDDNSLERLEFIFAVFGWLHLQMAYLKNIWKEYYGTDSGFGLKSAFSVLGRTGLDKPKTKGTFHEDLEHAMCDVLRAHVRACWLQVGGVSNLSELRTRHPESLRALARVVVQEYAAANTLINLEDCGDEWRLQTSMLIRDMLQYIVLDHAISKGNIGIMEAMLPHLLVRFVGGRNTNYTKEILELLQGLHVEWPPAVANFVREHCWLVNGTGKRNGFMAIDHAQEIRIKHIKVTHRSQGPSIDWKYLRKLHPVIPVIEAITSHMESEFQTWKRYKRHTTRQDELGIKKLLQVYENESLYQIKPGREITNNADRAPNFYEHGMQTLGKPMSRWVDLRTYARSTRQDFAPLSNDSDNDIIMQDIDAELSTSTGSEGE